jgi:hypothetical protein
MDLTKHHTMSKHQRVPTLGRDNVDKWFMQMRDWLEAEGVFWTVEGTSTPLTPSSVADGVENLSLDDPPIGGTTNIALFRQKDAKARYYIRLSLNEFDLELVEEERTSKAIWERLQRKYKTRLASAGRQYLVEFSTFKMDVTTSIDVAWQQINSLGKKVVEQRPELKSLNSIESKIQQLLAALPIEYAAYKAGIDARGKVDPEEVILILNEAQANINPEAAHYAKKPYQNSKPSFQKKDMPTRARSPLQREGLSCHLCGAPDHQMKSCNYISAIKAYGRKLRREHLDSKKSSEQISSQGSEVARLNKEIEYLKKTVKQMQGIKFTKAHLATQNESESTDSGLDSLPGSEQEEPEIESANFSKENVSTTTADSWISDSGASSHMTDNPSLFSEPPATIRRTTIAVGGGKLFSTRRGVIDVMDHRGGRFRLKDVLLVPELGVNLLSGRKLCKAGLRGSFDSQNMCYLDKDGKTVLHAKERGGIYILDSISPKLAHTKSDPQAFTATQSQSDSQAAKDVAVPATTAPDSNIANQDEADSESDADASDKKDVDNYMLYHRRFAHLGSAKIANLHKVTTMTTPVKVVKHTCQTCTMTKFRKLRGKVSARKDFPLERISVDTCGPFPTSREGFTQAMVIKDDHTRMSWMIPIKERKECPNKLATWKIQVERQSGHLLKSVRLDNATELVKHFSGLEEQYGIEAQTTIPHTSTQNGLVERENQQIENDMRALLKDSGLPAEFWVEACQAGIYIRNRTSNGPVINDHLVSPYEAFTGRVPNIDHIRVWGCKVHSYMERESIPQNFRRDKLMDKARVGAFLGYVADTSKQFLIWAPDRKDVIKTSNIKFFEQEKLTAEELNFKSQHSTSTAAERNPRGRPRVEKESLQDQTTLPENPRTVGADQRQPPQAMDTRQDDPTWKPSSVGADELSQSDRTTRSSIQSQPGKDVPVAETPVAASPITTTPVATTPTQSKRPEVQVVITKPPGFDRSQYIADPYITEQIQSRKRSREESNMEYSEDEQTAKHHKALFSLLALSVMDEDILQDEDFQSMTGYLLQQFQESYSPQEDEEVAFVAQGRMNIPVPLTYLEAIADKIWGDGWREAIQNELNALAANSTFEIVTPPMGCNIVSSKWVFATKFNTDGSLDKLKARLVARGFSQKFGVDYEYTFAPTLRHDTLRIFFALVAIQDLECHSVDVNNAFTESFLKEDIYMKVPPGMTVPTGQCLKVCRSLYGLKQAARDWNEKCTLELQKLGFVQSDADPCLLTHPDENLILLVYVDDILIASKQIENINWFKTEFAKVFKIKDLGEVKKILGVQVIRDRKKRIVKLDQAHYIREILSMYSMQQDKARKTSTPMNGYDSIRPAEQADLRTDQKGYQTLIGKLMYLAILTRPDISFALGRLSQYLGDPAEFHMSAARHILKYLRSTQDQGLVFNGMNQRGLIGYSDSDFASTRSDRLSILGNVFMVADGPVSWMSKKQKSVATSTMDAEYMAMCAAAKQSQWIALTLRDMGSAHLIGQSAFQPTLKQKMKYMIASPVLIKGDNQAALGLVRDAQISDRSKHIDVAYHYQRDLLKKNRLRVEFVGTNDMVADGLTKPLNKTPFERFVGLLGMQ